MKFETKEIAIKDLQRNTGQIPNVPKNPRLIKDNNFNKLKASIEQDPEMLELREIIAYQHEGKFICIGGNMRFEALKALGYTTAKCKVIADCDSEQLKRIILKDNSAYGEWDFDELSNEWDEALINACAIDIPEFLKTDEETEAEEADARDDQEERKRDPESEIIVATVSLFGTTEDMMLIETLTTDEADRLIAIAKKEGTAHLIKRLISAL